MVERHDLGFGPYEFHDNYLISEIGEGVSFGIDEISTVVDLVKQKYSGNFGYISNRTKDYSVDPVVWPFSAQLANLKVYAIVVSGNASLNPLKAEMTYLDESDFPEGTKFQLFTKLEEAEAWVSETLELWE